MNPSAKVEVNGVELEIGREPRYTAEALGVCAGRVLSALVAPAKPAELAASVCRPLGMVTQALDVLRLRGDAMQMQDGRWIRMMA